MKKFFLPSILFIALTLLLLSCTDNDNSAVSEDESSAFVSSEAISEQSSKEASSAVESEYVSDEPSEPKKLELTSEETAKILRFFEADEYYMDVYRINDSDVFRRVTSKAVKKDKLYLSNHKNGSAYLYSGIYTYVLNEKGCFKYRKSNEYYTFNDYVKLEDYSLYGFDSIDFVLL
ncbi:hypothetical protein LJB90_02430, partial [Eubacteriales bacterium OttesenSCG-928-G02]|nr:hypothetical protein [Eubacteriales bacterium OttesenSCG-928-G02]